MHFFLNETLHSVSSQTYILLTMHLPTSHCWGIIKRCRKQFIFLIKTWVMNLFGEHICTNDSAGIIMCTQTPMYCLMSNLLNRMVSCTKHTVIISGILFLSSIQEVNKIKNLLTWNKGCFKPRIYILIQPINSKW